LHWLQVGPTKAGLQVQAPVVSLQVPWPLQVLALQTGGPHVGNISRPGAQLSHLAPAKPALQVQAPLSGLQVPRPPHGSGSHRLSTQLLALPHNVPAVQLPQLPPQPLEPQVLFLQSGTHVHAVAKSGQQLPAMTQSA
jgi:hypothetical protein